MRYAGLAFAALCLLLAGCSARNDASRAAARASTPDLPTAAASAAASPVPPSTPSPSVTAGLVTVPPAMTPSAAAPVPVLGQGRRIARGYGSARPSVLDNGGDPTGILTNVSWQSWGGPEAVGTGMGYYDPPNVPVSRSVRERATVVAFRLGTCEGQYMYQAVEWYFPESGGSFSPGAYLDVCAWTFHQGRR